MMAPGARKKTLRVVNHGAAIAADTSTSCYKVSCRSYTLLAA